MKVCNLCNFEKDLELFKKDKRRNDGCASSCKECMRIKGLEYYHQTKDDRRETINENRRNSYERNKEYENIKSREYKENNKESIKKSNKEYYDNNKEILLLKSIEYRTINKDKINIYSKNYINDKLKNDVMFKLKHYARSMVRKSFRGYTKKARTHEILGCSYEDFKIHLESMFEDWMTWDNRGLYNGEFNYGWDVDHKIPLASAESEDVIIRLNHYTNLKPLCSYINRVIKKDNY